MKSFLKEVVARLLSTFSGGLGESASILMYHSFGDNPASFTVSAGAFRKQLSYLKEKKYNVIFLSELVNRLRSGTSVAGSVVITIDDGYLDTHTIALPILREFGFPATVFIIPGMLGSQMKNSEGVMLPLLSQTLVNEMSASGIIEFSPHSMSHQILPTISFENAVTEIEDARRAVSLLAAGAPHNFAFPKGKYNAQLLSYLKEHGFSGVLSVHPGLVRQDSDVMLLPRNAVHAGTTLHQFRILTSHSLKWSLRLEHFVGR